MKSAWNSWTRIASGVKYARSRGVKKLQLLRSFFRFGVKRKWCEDNPALEMKMPADPKPKERRPHTSEEISKIIGACDTFGQSAYERLLARAMILLIRFYGLRVSDVATLKRDPFPQGTEADCRYFFWSGAGDRDRHITTVDRTPSERVSQEWR